MLTSETTGEVFKALAAFQDEVGVIPKSDKNPFFKSVYAGLPAVVEAAQPILRKHGLAVVQTVGGSMPYGSSDTLTTRVHHASGEWFQDTAILHLTPTGENQYLTAQAQGSAVTYLRRYAYVTALGLICDEDDDGNAASLNDTTSTRTPTPEGAKRKRRTKAEMEAAKAEEDANAVSPPLDEPPVPDGWEAVGEFSARDVCFNTHNDIAQRITKLQPEDIAECVAIRQAKGWPMAKTDLDELAAVVSVKETFASPPEG